MKIEEIKYINIDGGNDDQIIDKLNELIKAHNERENIPIIGKTQIDGYGILKIGEDKPPSHFFKPEIDDEDITNLTNIKNNIK